MLKDCVLLLLKTPSLKREGEQETGHWCWHCNLFSHQGVGGSCMLSCPSPFTPSFAPPFLVIFALLHFLLFSHNSIPCYFRTTPFLVIFTLLHSMLFSHQYIPGYFSTTPFLAIFALLHSLFIFATL
jgi:hypothetical protein